MSRKCIVFLSVLFLGSFFAFAEEGEKKLEVVTTLFPTYDFARQIGRDKVNVSILLPPGVEPHAFEPRPKDVARINRADVFIYTGKYMEPWVSSLLKGVTNSGLAVVDASVGIMLIGDEDDHDGEEATGHGHRDHHHDGKDPHIWLDFGNAQTMVDTIAQAFAAKDPANSIFYSRNAQEYKDTLADLDRRFRETLSTARNRTLIYGGHFAFGYLAKRYGLNYESPYAGFSADAEPGPRAIAELIEKLKTSGGGYVYYEELLDPKVARMIANETGAKLELLHGAHNLSKDEREAGLTFITIMESDLEKLKKGLGCR